MVEGLGSDGWWLWGRGRRYCVEGAAGGGENCQTSSARTERFGTNNLTGEGTGSAL